MTRIWIGTSGYSYPDWVGPFYSPGTRPARMLSLYSRSFPLVELNYTFYRLPTASALARMTDQTPAGFQFVVKLTRSLSHEQNASVIKPFREAVEELRRRDCLLGVLAQFPQSFHWGRAEQQWIERLGRAFEGHGLAVEFRHNSWDRPEVVGWLHTLGITLVSVDVPDLPGLFPRRLIVSGPRLYVRLHSRNAATWYRSSRGRYDYLYTEEQLAEWVFGVEHHPELKEVLFLFNNCYGGQAIDNARRLRGLFQTLEPRLSVVSAPESSPAEARLF